MAARHPIGGPLAALALFGLAACGAPPADGVLGQEEVPQEGRARLIVLPEPGSDAPPALAGAALQETGRYLLVTAAGLAFHRSSWPVHALRTHPVPGSSLALYTWEEETPTGGRQAYYAYSRAGTAAHGRVRDTTYLVRLEAATFDPLRANLAPAPALDQDLMAAEDRTSLHLVQFHGTPLPELRQEVIRLGGQVLRFLSDHTFLVEMDGPARERVARLPFVRWVGPYHPAYRLERDLREALAGRAARLGVMRYSILLGVRGDARQEQVARLIADLGGQVVLREPGGLRIEALLSQEQLLQVARADQIQYIDRWGGPGEVDMDVVRELGGANAVELVRGWNGQGVRGEVFDTELLVTHREWGTMPIKHSNATNSTSYHGTSCYSNLFSQGRDPAARGMLPGAQGIFFKHAESTQFGGMKSRYDINRELIDPMGPYRAVFQTSSVGSALTQSYTTLSAEVDDYLFKHPILSTQSQSNTGNQNSRPQAWAKNIVSVGGFRHANTAARTDDNWTRSGSIGPAADGRIKPDLSYFYDSITSAQGAEASRYTQFGGTSSATPQTAGHFGLLFQMWHMGVWAGHGRKADVFTSRPKMATAKALMINMAYRYTWKGGGANADLDRYKQGWGNADVKRLYDRAAVTSVIDETDVLTPMGSKTYEVNVAPGQAELNVTLVYKDPMGTVGAAQARINDLSLRVTSPTGKVYWGNNGLLSDNYSAEGGREPRGHGGERVPEVPGGGALEGGGAGR